MADQTLSNSAARLITVIQNFRDTIRQSRYVTNPDRYKGRFGIDTCGLLRKLWNNSKCPVAYGAYYKTVHLALCVLRDLDPETCSKYLEYLNRDPDTAELCQCLLIGLVDEATRAFKRNSKVEKLSQDVGTTQSVGGAVVKAMVEQARTRVTPEQVLQDTGWFDDSKPQLNKAIANMVMQDLTEAMKQRWANRQSISLPTPSMRDIVEQATSPHGKTMPAEVFNKIWEDDEDN